MTTAARTPPPAPPGPGWARDLCHPLPMAAVLALALNDHLLKGAGLLPGWLTGKLSDLAGLFFFPLLITALAAAVSRAARRADRARLTAATALLTAAGFAAVKTSPAVNAWASSVWGPMRLDSTDLLALPMAGLSILWARRRAAAAPRPDTRRRGPRPLEVLSALAAAVASMATSAPRQYPSAQPAPPCALIRLIDCTYRESRITAVGEAVSSGAPVCRLEITEAVEALPADNGQQQSRTRPDALPDPIVLQRGERRTFTLEWSRPAPIARGQEPISMELQGMQWSSAERSGVPMWTGRGHLAGTCEPERPPGQVAQ